MGFLHEVLNTLFPPLCHCPGETIVITRLKNEWLAWQLNINKSVQFPVNSQHLCYLNRTSLIQTLTVSIDVNLENSVNCSMSVWVKGLHPVTITIWFSPFSPITTLYIQSLWGLSSQMDTAVLCLVWLHSWPRTGRYFCFHSACCNLFSFTAPHITFSLVAPTSCGLLQVTGCRDSIATLLSDLPSLDTPETKNTSTRVNFSSTHYSGFSRHNSLFLLWNPTL